MENKQSKCFIVRQSKKLKFTPNMRQNTFGGDPLVELKRSPDPLAAIRAYF